MEDTREYELAATMWTPERVFHGAIFAVRVKYEGEGTEHKLVWHCKHHHHYERAALTCAQGEWARRNEG